MKKKIGMAVVAASLALTAACSNPDDASEKTKNQTEEETTTTEVEETSTQADDSTETTTELEEEEKQEEYGVVAEELEVNKRDKVIYKNNEGKLTFIGETISGDGKIFAAFKADGEIKNSTGRSMSLKFIMDDGEEYSVNGDDITTYYANDDSLIWVFESSESSGGKVVRMDYTLAGELDGQSDEEEPEELTEMKEVKSLAFKDTKKTETIPALKEIPHYEMNDLNITRETEDYKIEVKTMSLSPEENKEVTFYGTIEPKKDTEFNEKFYISRPAVGGQSEEDISIPQDKIYKGVPVDFTLTYKSSYPIGKDKGAILHVATETFSFSVDLAKGKEYKNKEAISLEDLPNTKGNLYATPLDGYKDVGGQTYYNVIESVNPEWNWGISDEKERTTISYTLGSNYKNLKLKVGAGEQFKDSQGEYEFFIYGDDFNVEQDEEPTGTPLVHEKLKGNSPMKDYDLDVSGVDNLTIFYRTPKIEGTGWFEEDEGPSKYVEVLVADSKLTR
ncbi:hypothetical protein U8V72_11705 [Priestia filamentosa]|uniref:hypothetical protein n=1 Tax=Priestia filamentosa TaxID=1402861 RepID=UPI00058944D7